MSCTKRAEKDDYTNNPHADSRHDCRQPWNYPLDHAGNRPGHLWPRQRGAETGGSARPRARGRRSRGARPRSVHPRGRPRLHQRRTRHRPIGHRSPSADQPGPRHRHRRDRHCGRKGRATPADWRRGVRLVHRRVRGVRLRWRGSFLAEAPPASPSKKRPPSACQPRPPCNSFAIESTRARRC